MTEQILLCKIENQQYVLETGNLQGHVARLGYQGEDDGNEGSTEHKTALRITFDKEYPFNSFCIPNILIVFFYMYLF